MKIRRVVPYVIASASLVVAGACGASYDERMKYLDSMAERGVAYRDKLYEQHTEPSKDACKIGYDLVGELPPSDSDAGISDEWRAQVEEAFMKSCMTGELKPRPDVSGVDAVTPMPHSPRPSSPSVSAT